MLDSKFSIRNIFPPAQYAQWRESAEATLNGAPFEKKLVTRTYEGIDFQPVYVRADFAGDGDPSGFPGLPPFVRGANASGAVVTGWDLRQEHATPDLTTANAAILADLAGGVTSLLLVLDRAARAGFDPDHAGAHELAGRDGLMAYHVEDLDAALAEVELSMIGVSIEAGAAFLPAAAQMAALLQRRGHSPAEVRGAFNADPIAVLARDGILPVSLKTALTHAADLAQWTAENYPHMSAIGVDTAPYHHAGATAVQDLAFSIATAVEYLRAMTRAGMTIADAAKQILFRMSIGTHHFLAIAKLRAGRRLWARVVDACGGPADSAAMHVQTRISNRVLTRHDPYVNLLRNTVGVFAAGVAGADAITSIPFDYVAGPSNDFSRRVARNTGLILQEEAHLHRVIDPAGGSWFLETATDQLAEKAWETFQEIERLGGMIRALESGWVAAQIAAGFAPRAKDIATRKEGITGVSEFPNLDELPLDHPQPDPPTLRDNAARRVAALRTDVAELSALSTADSDGSAASRTAAAVQAAAAGATLGQLAESLGFHRQPTSITPLEPQPFAEPFEELRDACDAWQLAHGNRPRAFLANLGPVAHHTARANYSKSFFEAGGFEVITNQGFEEIPAAVDAFTQSGATVAVICSSDKLYPEYVPQLASRLKAAGARHVVLAGKPGANEEAWKAAGVDRFIFISCDVLGALRDMLQAEGVVSS
ncbi:methylmalonyl-CoA mutase family protein [Pirellulales bacterium]|nr:methylmalonyl-CoA mutase family protein [Pirellulales bacterium]